MSDRNHLQNLGFQFQGTSSGTPFKNLGFQRTGSGIFSKFRVPGNRFWDPFSNLGYLSDLVPGTLQNLGFLKVPEPVPRTGSKNRFQSLIQSQHHKYVIKKGKYI
jgi:hypothetical protein